MVMLNKPYDFAMASLYGSLLVNDATLSIKSNHSSNNCGSLAFNTGILLIKCKFSWSEEDLAVLYSASVVCWCKHWVLWVNSVWCLTSSTTD